MRKLSIMIASLSFLFSLNLTAQQKNIDLLASPNGDKNESDIEFIEHTKIGLTSLPNGGIGVRFVEYTDEEDGTQVISKSLPNEIIREVNCNCSKLVRFSKKDFLYATNLYYDDKGIDVKSLSDGKYKIEFIKNETDEILYTMLVKLYEGKLIIKKEFKSFINNNDSSIKIKKRTPQYIYINFND